MPRFAPEAHHIDILALALIAIGLFLGGVAYAHWTGGTLGDGAVRAMRFVLGGLGYAVPAALVALGALILLRELRPPARPMRTGALCLTAAITLALAAGTLGVGPGVAPARLFWHRPRSRRAAGSSARPSSGSSPGWSRRSAPHILAVFLFVAGVILVTGATLAGALRSTGVGVAQTGRALRRSTDDLRATMARPPATAAGRTRTARAAAPDDPFEDDPLVVPEPDTSQLVVRATHVEAPPIDGRRPCRRPEPFAPGLFDSEPEDPDVEEPDGEGAIAGPPPGPAVGGRSRTT